MKQNVRSRGRMETVTYIKKDIGEIRVAVSIKTNWVWSALSYTYTATIRKPNHQYYIYLCEKEGADDILDYISEQELYECYHNHWINISPLPHFSKYVLNGEHTEYSIEVKDLKDDFVLKNLGTSTNDKINLNKHYE